MRSLKTLFKTFGLIVLTALLLIDFGGCKTNDVVEDPGYAPAGKWVTYRSLGIHPTEKMSFWIKMELKNPNQEFYLRVLDGTLVEIENNLFKGFIPVEISYDRTHIAFALNLERKNGAFTGEGIAIQDARIINIAPLSGFPGATCAWFEMIKPN